MRRISIYAFILALVAGSSLAGPRIEVVGPAEVDFGKYNAWENKTASYKIRNSGKESLEILKIQKTCGCAEAKCDKTSIDPNAEAVIEVKVIPNSIFGNYSKATYVESNDTNNPYLRLMMRGDAIPLIDVQPSAYCYAGRVARGSEWKQSFAFKANIPGVRLGRPSVTNSHEYMLKTEHDENDGITECEVTLYPIQTEADFKIDMSFPVLAPAGHDPVRISIHGIVGQELVAVPGIMRFALSKESVKRKFFLKIIGAERGIVTRDKILIPAVPGVLFELSDDKDRGFVEVNAVFSSEFVSRVISEEKVEFAFKIDGAALARVVCRGMEK